MEAMMNDQPANDAAELSWGLKQSFRAYVEGAGGAIETGEGAQRAADGAFTFAAAPGEGLKLGVDGKPEGVGRFLGEVRCEAHGGMLKVFLADPSVEIGPAGAVLAVADTRARDRRVVLAQLDLAAATTTADGELVIPTKLSRDGWQVLGDHYLPATPLDPLRLKLARQSS
jgi:Htaa